MTLPRGTVILVELDPTIGHEQRGVRPCVVVGDPVATHHQRFPLVVVVPVTSTPGVGALYPRIGAGSGGLVRESWALADQVRAIDKRRVLRAYGQIAPAELQQIDRALLFILGLAPDTRAREAL